jgi:two-component system, NarL family, sensor histidine kinase DevS
MTPAIRMASEASRDVLDVARGVLGELDVERVLERVVESARELTRARYAAMGVLDESRTGLARFITTGVDESTRRQIGSLPAGRGVLGELIRDLAPLRLAEDRGSPDVIWVSRWASPDGELPRCPRPGGG